MSAAVTEQACVDSLVLILAHVGIHMQGLQQNTGLAWRMYFTHQTRVRFRA